MTAAKELRKTSFRYPFGLLVHGRRKGGKTLAFLLAIQRATRAVPGTMVPRSLSVEWICRRLLAWLCEVALWSW